MAESGTVLVVDDDPGLCTVIEGLLRQEGILGLSARSGEDALALLDREPIDVVVTDLRMPGMDGLELLARIRAGWPEVPVVMMSAHGTVSIAVDAIKRGAADFVVKFDADDFLYVLRKTFGKARYAAKAGSSPLPPGDFVGASPRMQECYRVIARAADSKTTILIRGETGTGKEVAARAIHERGPRRSQPFVAIHCTAVPDALLESELFGHEKGAFTGAVARKPGRVELAEGGTLFLDEIGDVTPSVQAKLLRFLQEKEYTRLGATETRKADVRILTATNRDLEGMVARGEFREDLLFRLNTITVSLPALRERPDDIGPLARHFCSCLAAENGRPGMTLDDDAVALLQVQHWPGNVRQLQNVIERLVVMWDGPGIGRAEVNHELAQLGTGAPPTVLGGPTPLPACGLVEYLRQVEHAVLRAALERSHDNRARAARLLLLPRRTFYNKLKEHGLV